MSENDLIMVGFRAPIALDRAIETEAVLQGVPKREFICNALRAHLSEITTERLESYGAEVGQDGQPGA